MGIQSKPQWQLDINTDFINYWRTITINNNRQNQQLEAAEAATASYPAPVNKRFV